MTAETHNAQQAEAIAVLALWKSVTSNDAISELSTHPSVPQLYAELFAVDEISLSELGTYCIKHYTDIVHGHPDDQ